MRNIRLLIQHTSTEFPFKVSHKAVFCLRRELPRCQIIITIVISCTRVQYVYVSENHKAWQLCSLLLWNFYCHYTTYVAYERIYLNLYITCLCITSISYYLSIWFEFRFGENGANILYTCMLSWMMTRGVVISKGALICCVNVCYEYVVKHCRAL